MKKKIKKWAISNHKMTVKHRLLFLILSLEGILSGNKNIVTINKMYSTLKEGYILYKMQNLISAFLTKQSTTAFYSVETPSSGPLVTFSDFPSFKGFRCMFRAFHCSKPPQLCFHSCSAAVHVTSVEPCVCVCWVGGIWKAVVCVPGKSGSSSCKMVGNRFCT